MSYTAPDLAADCKNELADRKSYRVDILQQPELYLSNYITVSKLNI